MSKYFSRFFFIILVFAGLGFPLGSQAIAASGAWVATDNTRLRVISQTDAVGTASTVTLGLHFQLNKHWKIYWRSPGDAGFPPSFDITGSKNIQRAEILWPLPERFSILGIETLGYKKEVVLPLRITLKRPGEALVFKAKVSYLACAEICIPHEANLNLSLPAGGATPSVEARLINRFASLVPRRVSLKQGIASSFAIESMQFKADAAGADTGKLYLTVKSDVPFKAPDAFVEGPDVLAFEKPRTLLSANGKLAVLEIPIIGLKSLEKPLNGTKLIITLSDAPMGAEFTLTARPASAATLALADKLSARNNPAGPPIFLMLAFALLGGLILNLMPCVLPVLSLKLLSMIGHGGGETRPVRLSFLASAAGILVSFLALAAVLLALKATGLAIGWGIQFQHPWFLIAMALVVTLFACNLWGFFEFHLPRRVSEIATHETHKSGIGGHFMTGVFATLLATPCSAPFLGTAVGFALARGPWEIFAIFAALGIGLAAPYLLVAAFPRMATRMPKPGRWMVILRIVLGFALAATAVWLVSVLVSQTNLTIALTISAILLFVTFLLYLHKRLGWRYGRLEWAAVAVLSVIAFAIPNLVPPTSEPQQGVDAATLESVWKPFDLQAIPGLVAQGKVVFVNVTADWCITCQVNKVTVLGRDRVYKRLKAPNTVAMEADWTRPSDVILRYITSFGRYGIPVDVVYGPGAPKGILLSEILTPSAVLEAFDKASRTPSP